jgi:hypothetical protein
MDPIEYSSEAEQALASLMGTLRNGNEADLTTRLVKVPKHGTVGEKARGRARMSQDIFDSCSLGSLLEPLAATEVAKQKKWGSFSRRPGMFTDAVRDDSLHKQTLRYFASREPCTLQNDAVKYANGYVSEFYESNRLGRLRPLDLDVAAVQFKKSGLGFPVVSSNVERYFEQVLAISRRIWDGGCDREWLTVLFALAGYRGQPLGPPDPDLNPGGYAKTRLIYMMPRALANLEKTIQKPLFDALKNVPAFCAWDSEHAVDVAATRLLSSGRRVLSIDFKKFDQSIPNEVLGKVYAIYRRWFVPEASDLIDFCEAIVKRTGIIIPDVDGTKGDYEVLSGVDRTGGMPSGCVMTNMSDSNVNAWVMAYTAKVLKTEILAGHFQGDDGAIVFKGDPSLADITGILSSHLGMTLSADKSSYERDSLTFLQNVHTPRYLVDDLCRGIRPIMHAANAAASHERADSADYVADDYETIRVCQQMGYCLHHPSVTEFADWLVDNDDFARDVLSRVRVDSDFYLKACDAVRRKDSNSQKGFSPQSLWASPVFQYLLSRV